MMSTLCTRMFAATLVAPAAALLPAVMPLQTQGLAPAEAAALHARFDPSLGTLRAGRIDAPSAFGAQERAELDAAQEQSASLAAMRGAGEPTNHEWKWLAIGAGIILLIILI